MHLNIFLFRRKFVFIKEWFCQSCYMHPKHGPHLPIHRTLSHEVSRSILGIRWRDFVRNSEVSLRTCLAPVSDRIIRYRNAIFGHVARLPVNTPAHQAMLRQVELSVGRPQTLHGNVHQVDHVVPNAAITTMFPLRLCGGKLLVAVTQERRYGLSRLRVNDDDDDLRYDTRCYFNVRSKADISQLNLPHGTDN